MMIFVLESHEGGSTMFPIDKGRLDNQSRLPNAKTQPLTTNSTVFDYVKLALVNLAETVTGLHIYDGAHWASNIDRWQSNLNSDNRTTYKRGTIVFLDLGSQNFKYEPSYTHACIIIAERRNSILVVPCSTKKFGSGYPDIIDATTADGFNRDTGIQSESFRWVSKNRVVSSTGKKVSATILNQLDEVLLSFAPSVRLKIKKLEADAKCLSEDKAALEEENEDLKEKIKALEQKLDSFSVSASK